MQPSRPFVFSVAALLALGVAVVLPLQRGREASAKEGLPLSTPLTAEMIDYFGLSDAFAPPSMALLAQCGATPACAASDTSRIRFFGPDGRVTAVLDARTGSAIEHVRRQSATIARGVTETRILVRTYATDSEGRIMMNGRDSIVKVDSGDVAREASTLTRVHRYSDVLYHVKDSSLVWPLTGLVVLDLARSTGAAQSGSVRLASHGAVSFDGTQFARVITTGALTHRVDLKARVLETELPDR
jgi:hypothetical protein